MRGRAQRSGVRAGAALGAGHRCGGHPDGDRMAAARPFVPVLRDRDVRGGAAGRARGLGVLRGSAERGSGGADGVRERAGGAGRAGHGHAAGGCRPRRAGWTRPAPGWRRSWGRPGSRRRCSRRWPGRRCWPRTRPRVNVLDKNPQPAAREGQEEGEQDPEEKENPAAGAPHALIVRTPDGRLTWLQALASRRKGDIAAGLPAAFTGYLMTDGYTGYQHLLSRLAGIQQCAAHVIRRCRAVTKLGPGGLQSWAGDIITILREAHQATDEARARGDTALDPEQLDKLRQRYDEAAAFGITHNRLRDWHEGNHPGYALGCWLRDYKEQVFLFTRDFAVDWTNNVSERGAKAAKRHQAVSGYWHTLATLARWCRIRSYLDSAAAHGLTALEAITAALSGKPWLPAIPAAA